MHLKYSNTYLKKDGVNNNNIWWKLLLEQSIERNYSTSFAAANSYKTHHNLTMLRIIVILPVELKISL